ncbi:conserved hypothetical protein, partial [Listeria marthii FSL S4-120]
VFVFSSCFGSSVAASSSAAGIIPIPIIIAKIELIITICVFLRGQFLFLNRKIPKINTPIPARNNKIPNPVIYISLSLFVQRYIICIM